MTSYGGITDSEGNPEDTDCDMSDMSNSFYLWNRKAQRWDAITNPEGHVIKTDPLKDHVKGLDDILNGKTKLFERK